MSRWYAFVRSQEEATASVAVDVGIEAARDIPTHPLAFVLVRRLEDGADPDPLRRFEERLSAALLERGVLPVGTLTMSGSRTLICYGNDEGPVREIVDAAEIPLAMQAHPDPDWSIYRTLLPTEEELA